MTPAETTTRKRRILMILALALPAIIENFFQTIIGFVDTLFVSQLGLVSVSAVGVANRVLAVYFAIFMSAGIAANVLVAKHMGIGNKEKAKQFAQQSILLSIVLGILFGITTLFFASPLMKLMGVEPAVLEAGTTYFKIVAVPSIFISLMFVLSCILRGTGDTKSPMKVSIGINLLHIVLDYVFIFGFAFFPAMGLAGAAIATVAVRVIGVIALLSYLRRSESKIGLFNTSYWKVNKVQQKELIFLGSPAAAERLVMRIGQVLYFGFIVQLGTATFAAHQIAGSIEVFSYMIGYGMATAATILVGQNRGAGRLEEAKEFGKLAVLLSIGIMTLMGIFLFIGGEWAGTFFTKDQEVIGQIGTALRIDAFIQPILAAVLVLTGVFQGAENTRYPMYLTAIGIWILRTSGVYLLGLQLEMGIAGVWLAIGVDNLFRALFLWRKFTTGQWMKKGHGAA